MKALINTIKSNENAQVAIFFGSVFTGFGILLYYILTAGTAPCFGF